MMTSHFKKCVMKSWMILSFYFELTLCQEVEQQHFREIFPFLNETEVPDASIKYFEFDEGNYTGQLDHNGQKSGWGEILWNNGTLYGPGDIFIYSLGDKYFGQWENDKQEGIGTFYSQTGVYVGQWSHGLQNGDGKAFFNNGNKYEGQFKDGFKEGRGVFTVVANGDVYNGEFHRGMRQGQGIEIYGQTRERYVGTYDNDTRNGQGTAYYADGSTKYIGEWKNGSPEGNGTYFLPQRGLKFIGEFSGGRPTGQGTIYDANGEVVGPWGSEINTESPGGNFLQNFGLLNSNNKYSNLIGMISNWVSGIFDGYNKENN